MLLGKNISVVAVACAFLGGFNGPLSGAEACSCLPDRSLCDDFREADMVLRAKAISRAGGSSSSDMAQFAEITYTVEVITTYKGADEVYGNPLTFTTWASSSLCGISMDIGNGDGENQEYLLDLQRTESTGELRAVGLCGVFKEWSDGDAVVLEGGCASTTNPAPSSDQAIIAASNPDDSSALRLSANACRGLIALGVGWVLAFFMVL